MSPSQKPTAERNFEDAIEHWLLEHGGYTKAPSDQFDAKLGLDPTTLVQFLQETQKDTWQALQQTYGSNVESKVVDRIASECDRRGLLDVIRIVVDDRGQHLKLAYFRPPTALNPETERLHRQNRLTVMRQVHYDLDSNNSIDLLLSVNGLPIATVELKNAMTGQRSLNAILQYIKDRQPTPRTKLLEFKKRALVHFAVDTDEAYMVTRLAGKGTYFLPFNTGDHGGKGNPTDHAYETGYKTGYLWEQVWPKDSWLDIIHRFIHVQVEERKDPETGKTRKSETLNERFGTDWTDEDMLLLDQIKGDMLADEVLAEQARVNTKDQFRPVFQEQIAPAFIRRRDRNIGVVEQFISNPDIREFVMNYLLEEVFRSARG